MKANSSFSASYEIARKRLLAAAKDRGLVHEEFVHPEQDPLLPVAVVDVVRIGPRGAKIVLFITSGVHGTELTAGSGVQLQLIDTFTENLPVDCAVVMIHAVNSVGCARLSRTDENNVDPNRNVRASFDNLSDNSSYDALHVALCPNEWSEDRQEADKEISEFVAQNGEKALIQDVLQGQYNHPDGLFFGGNSESWTISNMTRIVRDHAEGAVQVGIVDLHTGVGPYGFGEVMRLDRPPIMDAEWEKIDNLVCSIVDRVKTARPPIKIILEYGTYPFDRVLTALRADNWLRHYGSVHTPQGRKIKKELQDALFADDPQWLEDISKQGITCCQNVLDEMIALEKVVAEFETNISSATTPEQVYQSFEAVVNQHIGTKLFTVMDYVADRNMGRRSYTSDPEHYPVSGWIELRDNAWFDCVVRHKRTYVANDLEQISKDFADASLIANLGCESIVNLPLVVEGSLVATVNLLNGANYFTDQKLADIHRILRPLAGVAYLASNKLTQ